MGGLIKRQHLTERQYLRANRVMCLILLVSYIVYAIVEIRKRNRRTGMYNMPVLLLFFLDDSSK